MKLLSRLIIALAVCLIAIPLMATPVEADIDTMSLRPRSSGNVGEEIYITGYSTDDGRYYVYYQVADDEWVKVLDYRDIDFEDTDEAEEYYYYTTEEFQIPESCSGKHTIAIVNRDLGSTTDDYDINKYKERTADFTVKPKVEITKPTDAKSPLGTEVTVKGTGFEDEEDRINILFDGEVVSAEEFEADEYGTWTGTFLVPATSKGEHDVSAEGRYTDEGDVTKAIFTVTPGISLDIVEGSPGDTITVEGSGFEENEGNIKILFGGQSVATGIKADSDGLWTETFAVPAAVKGKHTVEAEGAYTPKRDVNKVDFEVVPAIVLSPTEGHVGTTLTVSGGGFPANKEVTISYAEKTKASATTDSKGSFSAVSFEATHTQAEHTPEQPVEVTYDTTTLSTIFTMESVAPAKPTLSLPVNASRVGLFGKQTATFEWSEVTDDSGVSYNLQIGTSADFAQVLISKTGLTEASYTLTGAEALSYGTYYWRVKAVDGAQNDSGWTTAYSFKSGLLPLWAFIAIVALIVVLIGALVFVFGIRKRAPFD